MRSLINLTCALTLLATPVATGDDFVVDSSDPLLLSSEPRLRAIIEAINDRKAIELLLGEGIPLTDDGTTVLYNVIPGGIEQIADRNIAEDFVDQVQVDYGPNGEVSGVRVPIPKPVLDLGPKFSDYWWPQPISEAPTPVPRKPSRRSADPKLDFYVEAGRSGDGTRELSYHGSSIAVAEAPEFSVSSLESVKVETDSSGSTVMATLSALDGPRLAVLTAAIAGTDRLLVIVFDDEVIFAAKVYERIEGGSISLTGSFTRDEANELGGKLAHLQRPVTAEEESGARSSASDESEVDRR